MRSSSRFIGWLARAGTLGLCLAAVTPALAQDEQVAGDAPEPVEVPENSAPSAAEAASTARLDALDKKLAEQEAKIDAQSAELKQLNERAEAAEQAAADASAQADMALEMGTTETESSEELLRMYGFADMAFNKKYISEDSRFNGLIDGNSTFAVGNVNLYLDAKPIPTFRVLSEIRFTLLPHGSSAPADGTTLTTTDTSVLDITSATGRNRVLHSGVVIERTWIEWNKFDFFKVRTGYFLTPYGIWNVDHGSPTLISSVLPSFWAEEYFPTRQIGLQFLGEFFVDDWELGYRAWVGNGRMLTSQIDTDFFKHFGGRAYALHSGETRFQVGTSAFYGRQAEYQKDIVSFDPFSVESTQTEEYKEYGLAADVSLDWKGVRVRSEFVFNQETYEDGLRRQSSPVTYQRDRNRYSTYGIVAYRLPWVDLEPYVYIERTERPGATDNTASIYSGGLIWHIDPAVQLKFQGYQVHFHNDETFPDASSADFPGWDLRLVATF